MSIVWMSDILVNLFEIAGYGLLILFVVFQDCQPDSGGAKLSKNLWFLPGVLGILEFFLSMVSRFHQLGFGIGYVQVYGLLGVLCMILNIAFLFLLGWWITHPYVKKRPIYSQGPYPQYNNRPIDPMMNQGMTDKAFCTGCGKQLLVGEVFCGNCGTKRVQPAPAPNMQAGYGQVPPYSQSGYTQDAPSTGMAVLGFFFPGIGLILYLVWKDQTPLKAKSAGKGALIGAIVGAVASVILAVLAYVIPLLVFSSMY